MKAKDLMNSKVYYVKSNDSLLKCASMMKENHIHFLPVIEDGKVIGTITDHDLCIYGITEEQNFYKPVENIMRKEVHAVSIHDSLGTIFLAMQKSKVKYLLVHQDNKIVGIISFMDILRLNRSQDPFIITLKEIYNKTEIPIEQQPEIDTFYL